MSGSKMLSFLRQHAPAWRMLVAGLLFACATPAFAADRPIWTNPFSDSSGNTCADCHGNPPLLSATDGRAAGGLTAWNQSMLQAFANRTAVNGATVCNQVDPGARFRCWFPGVPLTNSGQTSSGMMFDFNALAQSNSAAATAMGQYIIDMVDGSVTTAVVDFGNVPVNGTGVALVTITNPRYADIRYLPVASPGGEFTLTPGGESCATRVVPGSGSSSTNSCTVSVTFHPLAAGTPTVPLSIAFAATVAPNTDPRPATVSVQLKGRGVAPLVPQIQAIPTPVATGTVITLDGSASAWPNGVTGTYTWDVVTPSGTHLGGLTGSVAHFTASPHGVYTIHLTLDDGFAQATSSAVTTQAIDRPVAAMVVTPAAAPHYRGAAMTFDASTSTHQAGHTLNTTWSLTPPGTSGASLVIGPLSLATLTPDVAGSYTVTVAVDDQGIAALSTLPFTFSVVTPPPPHADAGTSHTVLLNAPVALNGTNSTSSNGQLHCTWTVLRPDATAAPVASPNLCSTTFTPDVTGPFAVSLAVSDTVSTATASITITSSNLEVIASAGSDQTTVLGAPVALSGSATSTVGDTLTYAWAVTKPDGHLAVVATPAALATSFTPDMAGTYVAQLTATDQHGHVGVASATITVQPPLSVSTSSLSFTAAVGASFNMSAIVTNNAATPTTLQSIAFGGTVPGDYALDTSNACVPGSAIVHGVPCTLVVRFTPSAVGARNATASLAYAGSGSPAVITLLGTATPAPQGVLGSSTWTQSFDDTVLGTTSSKSITLSNTSAGASGAPILFSSFAVGGAAAADFSLAGTCDTAVPLLPQASCTLVVTFAPSATGARAASVNISSNATNASATIALTGNGLPVPVPAVGLQPASLDFGQQTVGGAYPPQVETVTNIGQAPLSISAVTVAGNGFAIADAAACSGATLAVGASCQISVRFAPPSVQASFTGTLTLVSNAPTSPTALGLVGIGTAAAAPVLAWSPPVSTLDFGTVQTGVVSPTQSIVLTNQGPGGAILGFVNAIGTGSSAFAISAGTCVFGQTMFAGASCRLDIAFAPAVAGGRSATLQVVSNGSAPAPVMLAGTGLGGPALALTMSSGTIDFGAVQLGTRSVPTTLRLSNSGASALQVTAITASGPFSVQASSCPAAPFTLQSGAECAVSVTYLPTATGASTGTLAVQSDAQGQPADVALVGHADSAPDLSSGGCSLSDGSSAIDPTLWGLVVLALIALGYRARQRRRDTPPTREARS